jgi:hypothetical protein
LTPELQALVRTPEFKAWFGDWEANPAEASQMVDENGEPRLVYFGGPAGITRLHGGARDRTGSDEVGFYFTQKKNVARFYAQTLRDRDTDEPAPSSLYSAFLNIRNPYERQLGDGVVTERVTEVPDACDGYVNQVANEIVVFSPDQVNFVAEQPINIRSDEMAVDALASVVRR